MAGFILKDIENSESRFQALRLCLLAFILKWINYKFDNTLPNKHIQYSMGNPNFGYLSDTFPLAYPIKELDQRTLKFGDHIDIIQQNYKGAKIPLKVITCELLQVIDGDTLKVLIDGKAVSVRLDFIDAPEKNQIGYVEVCKVLNAILNKTTAVFVLKETLYSTELYQRLLGSVYILHRKITFEKPGLLYYLGLKKLKYEVEDGFMNLAGLMISRGAVSKYYGSRKILNKQLDEMYEMCYKDALETKLGIVAGYTRGKVDLTNDKHPLTTSRILEAYSAFSKKK